MYPYLQIRQKINAFPFSSTDFQIYCLNTQQQTDFTINSKVSISKNFILTFFKEMIIVINILQWSWGRHSMVVTLEIMGIACLLLVCTEVSLRLSERSYKRYCGLLQDVIWVVISSSATTQSGWRCDRSQWDKNNNRTIIEQDKQQHRLIFHYVTKSKTTGTSDLAVLPAALPALAKWEQP